MKKLLKTLVIDTATNYYYLALIDEKIIDEVYSIGHNDHSANLMPSIENMLKKANLKLKDIENVLVGIGPGSYTGIRIGVVVAKMIGYLNNINVYTFSSLDLLATAKDSKYVLSLIDARRGNAFMAYYKNNKELEKIIPDCLENIEEFKKNLKEEYEISTSGKPNPLRIPDLLLTKVENIHELVPNYLQVTEAERNKYGN